ncbi:MAG: hypothetical protein Salg2KO_09730 [Salibacteraceae bacterium]
MNLKLNLNLSMKNSLKLAALFVVGAGVFTGCNLNYFQPDNFAGGSFKSTYAAPIADLNITVEDLLNLQSNNILTENDNGRNFLKLIFSDTIEGLTLDDYAVAGVVPAGVTIPVPSDRVDLKIFGNFADGTFRLTNPSVTFTILNETAVSYEMRFRDGNAGTDEDFFTQRADGSNKRILEVDDADHPYPIDANANYTFTFNNDNVIYKDDPTGANGGAMTQIMEPTPKFLNYGVNLTTTSTSTDASGSVDIVADVELPLQGFGNVTRIDTANYEFLEEEQTDFVNFAELRFAVRNGLPITGAIVSAVIIDTTQGGWVKVMDIPLYETDGGTSDGILIQGADPGSAPDWKTTPADVITDIILSRERKVQPVLLGTTIPAGPELNEIEAVAQGNKMIIEIEIRTTDFDQTTPSEVKIYTDQSMQLKLGFRAQAAGDINNLLELEE